MDMDLDSLRREAMEASYELLSHANLAHGDLAVIGCSTSEILGRRIGTAGSSEIAKTLYDVFDEVIMSRGINLAFQCCEHLNRALVIPADLAVKLSLPEVHVLPIPEAGGAMAAEAFARMPGAVVVEELNNLAKGGMDIGETHIAMHIRPVVVPLRLSRKYIGEARLTACGSRAKLIGGHRAVY